MKHSAIVPALMTDAGPNNDEGRGPELRELWNRIWRRRGIVVGTVLGGTALTYLILLLMTPRFTASAFIMIDARQEQVANIEAVMSGLSADSATVATEAEVLRSRALAELVIARLNLQDDPEFNPNFDPGIQSVANDAASQASGSSPTASGNANDVASQASGSSSTAGGNANDVASQASGSSSTAGGNANGAASQASGSSSSAGGNANGAASQASGSSPTASGNANDVASQASGSSSTAGGNANGAASQASGISPTGQVPQNSNGYSPADSGSVSESFSDSFRQWRDTLTGKADEASLPEEEKERLQHAQLVDTFLSKIAVQPRSLARVIQVSVTTTNPVKSALIANTLADLYVSSQLEFKAAATAQATSWLTSRVDALKTEVASKEKAVEAFRAKAGLVQGTSSTLAVQQISEITSQLVAAQADRSAADARLSQVQKLLNSPQGAESAAEVLDSPLIQALKEKEAELRRQIAELSSEYGPRHPNLINAKAQIADLQKNILAEVNKIVASLTNQAQVAQAREESLRANLNEMKAKVNQLSAYEVQLHSLEREATASRTLLENFLARSKETAEQQGIQQADARVISRAEPPARPSFPNTRLLMSVALPFFGVLGVALALLAEALEQGIRSTAEVEEMLGVPALGLVPTTGLNSTKSPPERVIVEKPTSMFGEAIRSLRTALLLSNPDKPPKTILFTSSLPNEGKTSTTVALARMLAASGKRVVVVDGDLRRPTIHRLLGGSRDGGLIEWIAGEAELEQITQKDELSPLHFLTSGAPVPNPTELLGSERARQLFELLSQSYDFVVVDSSPVMAVSDSRVLSRLVDATVFVVRWGQTPRDVVRAGVRQIQDSGATLAGVLLTQVDARRQAKYGYGDSAYYYGATKKYYTS